MKKYIYILVALYVLSGCTSKADRTMGEINLLLDSLQIQYAPDIRVALWDLTLSEADGELVLSGGLDQKEAYKAVVRAIDQNFPQVKNQLLLLPENGDGNLVNGLVNNSVANFRAGRSSRTELVTQALLGSPVRILKEEEGWYLVQASNSYLGWVNRSEVRPLERTRLDSFRLAHKLIFNKQYGVSYSEPDEASMPVSDLVIGCILPVEGHESGFYKFWYPDGRAAWVKVSEVIDAKVVFNKSLTGEGMVNAVLKFNGIPYLWGGSSSKAIDCSGLTSNVFFMNGAVLPRDADQQSLCGKEISSAFEYQDLMVGDLLFFGRKATDTQAESVTHVAMYLGDSEFIHSAGFRDRVSINSMDPNRDNFIPTYPEIFIRSARFIGEEGAGFEPITDNRFYKEIIPTTE